MQGFAEAVDCPVALIADIDRGGVCAQLVGTLALLSESERSQIIGFVINRFRGDRALLEPGLEWLEAHTARPVLGVLPYLHDLHLDAEDAIGPAPVRDCAGARAAVPLRVLVPVVPHISNHSDFDPLRLHPQVDFRYARDARRVQASEVVGYERSRQTDIPRKDYIDHSALKDYSTYSPYKDYSPWIIQFLHRHSSQLTSVPSGGRGDSPRPSSEPSLASAKRVSGKSSGTRAV